jgi:hypothetical protein
MREVRPERRRNLSVSMLHFALLDAIDRPAAQFAAIGNPMLMPSRNAQSVNKNGSLVLTKMN